MSIAVSDANTAYVYVLAANNAYGYNGLYRSTNSGTTFTTRSTSPNVLGYSSTGGDTGGQGWYDLALAVSPLNAEHVIVGGVNIWRSTTGGTSWTINAHWTGSGAPYVHADIHALEYLPGSGTTYFAGCDGGIFKTTNSGTAWADLSAGLQIAQIYRIGCSATNSNLLLTGWQDNGTNRHNTGAWSEVLGGDGMEALIDFTNANVQYGELYYGDIYRTTTGGNLTTNIVGSGGTGVNADGDWVTPYIINPQRANTLVVGKAQAYRSFNRGTSWAALGATAAGTGNLNAMAFAPTDSNYLYVSKYDRFFVSTNSGTSFTDRTTGLPVASAAISYIAVASNNPQHVWVTFSGYSAANKVWYSANAGVTWTNYTTGLPNLPANCIVYQNGSTSDALYVGTDVGVYYRDNTASSWVAYNAGLPNVIIKELEIQYGISKLRAATFGRGVWQSDLNTPGTSPPVADFSASKTSLCVGDCISFTDLSVATPTSWSWTFTGGTPSSSTLQNPTNICYSTPGTYAVTLTATNVNGSNTMTKTAYITVSTPVALPLAEGFQGGTFVPAGWSLNNADLDVTWSHNTSVGGFMASSSSAMMDNYSSATSIAGTIDEMVTPKYNFSGYSSATMTFDVAYARYNATYNDSLRVLVSTDCGSTWTAVYSKGGFSGLQTSADNSTSAFVPTTAAQWRTETVNMTPYVGQPNVIVKFQNRSGWGQNLYLDNINITGAGAVTASVTIALTSGTNPMCAGASATFTATPVNGGTTPVYQWQVNGANVGTNSPTYTTSTLTNGQVVTCIMTSSLSGVTGSPATSNSITMTVNPLPATPAPTSNSPVCAGSTLNLSTTAVTGASYSWTGPGGYTSSLQNPARTSATAAMAGTYSVTVTVAGCTSLAGTTTVVINPIPATPTATSSSPVCVGSPINLFTPTVTGATYAWTGPAAYTSTVQNPVRPSATAVMAGTYSVTVTVAGCTSAAAGTTMVVVNPAPATPTANSNSPICAGTTLNLSTPAVSGATYSWTGPSGYTSSLQNPVISTATTAAAGTYSVTVTTGGCTSAAGTTVVVVNATPATPTAGSNSPVCAGGTLNLTTPAVAGATYSWTGPGSFTSSLQNPVIAGVSATAAGTYSVTVTSGGCISAAGTTVVVITSAPATPTASSSSPDCAGQTLSLSTPTVAGATYSWTGPGGYTSAVQNPTRPSATTAMSGTYSVTVSVGGCTSAAGTTTVVVNAIPATPSASSSSPDCVGQPINLSTPTVTGATYSWTGPGTYTSAVQNPVRPVATAGMAGTYSVTVTVGGCTSAAGTTTVVVNPTPATPTATSSSPDCAGQTLSLSTPTVGGATYSWTGPGGYTATIRNPTRPAATVAMSGTYSVTVTTGGCTSAAGTVNVVINAIPATPTALSNSPVCTGSTLSLSTATLTGATYSWTGPGGYTSATQNPNRPSATTGMAGTYSLTVTVAGCTSAAGTTAVVVSSSVVPTNTIAITSGSNPGCAGANVTFTATPTGGGTTPAYQWKVDGVNVGTNSPTFSSSTLTTGQVVTCELTSGSTCASPSVVMSNAITMIVNPVPATPTATSSSPVCEGSDISLSTATVAGAGYSWTGPGSFTSSAQNPVITSSTPLMSGTYSVTVTSSGCTSAAGITTVTVDPVVNTSVSIALTTGTNPACSGASLTFTASISGGGSAPVYQWMVNGVNVGTNSPTFSTSSLNNNDVVSCSMASSEICASPVTAVSSGITMIIDPSVTPAISISIASGTNPACAGSTIMFLASTSNGGSTPIYQWQVNGVNAGTNMAMFTSSTLNNGDVVTCNFSSSAVCAVPATLTSNSIVMTVNPIPPTPVITQSGTVLSSSAATGNQWYLDGVLIPGATDQNYTLTGNGSYTVIVTLAGCSSPVSNTITVIDTGVEASENTNALQVYPNPNDGNFTLSFNVGISADYTVEIINSLGQLVFREELKNFKGEYKKALSVVQYGKGVYTLSLTNDKNEQIRKVLVY
jgi:PKD repeat protein